MAVMIWRVLCNRDDTAQQDTSAFDVDKRTRAMLDNFGEGEL